MTTPIDIPALPNVPSLVTFLNVQHGYDLLSAAPPVDVDKIARLLGIEVDEAPDFDDVGTIGRITLESGKRVQVWINPFENSYGPRRRFTLAHEIGHFCMHRSLNKTGFVDTRSTMSRSESYWNRYESEANSFAAELLMPSQLIKSIGRRKIDEYKVSNEAEAMPMAAFIEVMAAAFRVSNKAMEYRLKNMGIGKKS